MGAALVGGGAWTPCPGGHELSTNPTAANFFNTFFKLFFKYDTVYFFPKLTLLAASIRMARRNHVAAPCMGTR